MLFVFVLLFLSTGCSKDDGVQQQEQEIYGTMRATLGGDTRDFKVTQAFDPRAGSNLDRGRIYGYNIGNIDISVPLPITVNKDYQLEDGVRVGTGWGSSGLPGQGGGANGWYCSSNQFTEVTLTFSMVTQERVKGNFHFVFKDFEGNIYEPRCTATNGSFDIQRKWR